MESRFPKNVRQIGNVSDTPKIYIEDYVDTFLNQICDKAGEEPVGAFLVGHSETKEEQECVYIYGAVRMEEMEMVGPDIAISDTAFEAARDESRKYFGNAGFVGWFIVLPGRPLMLNSNLSKLHAQHFDQTNTVLIMKETAEKDELYFTYKYKELMQMSGHYIYYEKNPAMQNYMITTRKKIGVTPSESVEDKAAKEFRSIVRERSELQEQRRNSRFMYATSVFLVLVVLIIGVTTINNYDKMQLVQSSLEDIKNNALPGKEEVQDFVETGGQASAADVANADGASGETADGKNVDAQSSKVNGEETDAAVENDNDKASEENKEETGAAKDAVSTMQEMSEDIYVVEKGDTLARISKKVYGDIGHVDAICRMNGLKDGNLIFIGQKLLLP